MKQKIKEFAYKIPLETKGETQGNIIVATHEIPQNDGKVKEAISIALALWDNLKSPQETLKPQWRVIIPQKKIKALRKIIKKAMKTRNNQAYTIFFKSENVQEGRIVVERKEIKNKKVVLSIALKASSEILDTSPQNWKVIIPQSKAKDLRKVLKKVAR